MTTATKHLADHLRDCWERSKIPLSTTHKVAGRGISVSRLAAGDHIALGYKGKNPFHFVELIGFAVSEKTEPSTLSEFMKDFTAVKEVSLPYPDFSNLKEAREEYQTSFGSFSSGSLGVICTLFLVVRSLYDQEIKYYPVYKNMGKNKYFIHCPYWKMKTFPYKILPNK